MCLISSSTFLENYCLRLQWVEGPEYSLHFQRNRKFLSPFPFGSTLFRVNLKEFRFIGGRLYVANRPLVHILRFDSTFLKPGCTRLRGLITLIETSKNAELTGADRQVVGGRSEV